MTDYIWPTGVIPAKSQITLRDLSARFSSPFTGTTRTYSRVGGELIGLELSLPPLRDGDKAAVTSLIAKLRGGVNRVWCKDHSYVKRGSFPATEIVQNGTFSVGDSGWGGDSATARTAVDRALRVTYINTTLSATGLVQALTFVSGAKYVMRSASYAVAGSLARGMQSGIDSYSTEFGSTSIVSTDGVQSAAITPTQAAGFVNIEVSNTGASVGDSFDVLWMSVARCALIKGAQAGARVLIDALPTSTNGLLLEGDQVQIGNELFHVAAALNSNSSGEGYLTLHRPPRTSFADNAPVIIHEPMGLFMLASSENSWENVPGRFTGATVSLIEAV